MSNNIKSKEEMINEIAKKMKFLGTYKYFKREELEKKSFEELHTQNEIYSLSVKVHSNPEYLRVIKAIRKGKMDPRWEPFVSALKSYARDKKDKHKRKVLDAFIKHICTSDLLLQYISAMINIIVFCDPVNLDLTIFNKILIKYFKRSKVEYLLYRSPMEFTWLEEDCMKVLLQASRIQNLPLEALSDIEIKLKNDLNQKVFKKMVDELQKYNTIKDVPIKCPQNESLMFGKDRRFEDISIFEYGELFNNALDLKSN